MSEGEPRNPSSPASAQPPARTVSRRTPLWIALAYLAFGAVWIFLTDRALVWLNVSPERAMHLQTSKGWLFVLASAVLVYALMKLVQRCTDSSVKALYESQQEVRRINAELERRVAQRTQLLETANRELESFAYAVSHDLRAPLRSMSGFSQLLLESDTAALDEKSRHYLKRIHDASGRMSALIEDLLNLSRISRADLAPRIVDLTQLVAEVAASVRERYPGRTVALEIEDGMKVTADPRLLRIAIENLLDNAWKYTAHSNPACVRVGSQVDERGRTYFVSDNGVGFDMAYAGKLFGPFQRLHPESQYPGTGVGLVTVQRILVRHGGRIWAQAEVNHGATFYFTFGEAADEAQSH